MFDLVVMMLFIIVLWISYSKTGNKSPFWFLIPLGMTTILNTSWPSTWTEGMFVVYRLAVIAACFGAGLLYYQGTKRHRARMAEQAAEEEKARKKEKNNKKKKK